MITLNPSSGREIISTRLLKAPRELIFRAFSEPEHLAQWWGPKGFRNTFHEFDFTPGGRWRFGMHGPDGTSYSNNSVFQEVVTPERIVFQHEEPGHRFQMTITFAAENGDTRLTWRMVFETAEECGRARQYIPQCNEENFDRLEAELTKLL